MTIKFWLQKVRKLIKGFKDSHNSLVSKKNLIQKMARWVGSQGQVNLAKNMPPL